MLCLSVCSVSAILTRELMLSFLITLNQLRQRRGRPKRWEDGSRVVCVAENFILFIYFVLGGRGPCYFRFDPDLGLLWVHLA